MGTTRQQKIDEGFMQQAIDLANKASSNGEVPVGALVVIDNQVVATGWNQTIELCDPSAHAEVLALRKAAHQSGSHRLGGATLYVTLEPCLMCCGIIQHARVERLVYGAREPRTGAVVSTHETLMQSGTYPRISIVEGVLAEQSTAIMQTFFKAQR